MQPAKIVIADDDRTFRAALRTRLAANNYHVIECPDGLGALSAARFREVDAFILDQEMPLGEGRAMAERIRACSPAPIVFISGAPADDFRETVTRLASTYYFQKPVDTERLLLLLERVLPATVGSV